MNCRVCPPGNVMLMSFSLGAVDLALLNALAVIDSLGDPIFQLSNRGLVVGEFQKLFAGTLFRLL